MTPKKRALLEKYKWKKGQSGNPKGRTPISEEMKKAKRLNQAQFALSVNKLMYMSLDQLADTIKDTKNTSVIDGLIARILYKGLTDSSRAELNYFIERFCGKVPDNVNLNGNFNGGLVDFLEQLNNANEGETDGEEEDPEEESS